MKSHSSLKEVPCRVPSASVPARIQNPKSLRRLLSAGLLASALIAFPSCASRPVAQLDLGTGSIVLSTPANEHQAASTSYEIVSPDAREIIYPFDQGSAEYLTKTLRELPWQTRW